MAVGSLVIAPFASAPLTPLAGACTEVAPSVAASTEVPVVVPTVVAPQVAPKVVPGAVPEEKKECVQGPDLTEITIYDLIIALGLGVAVGTLIGSGCTYAALQFSHCVSPPQ
jgi:hypothetical protein